MKNGILVIGVLLLSAGFSFGQSKKEIRKFKIRSTTSTITETVNGKDVTRTDSYEKYDADGNVIEEVSYNKDGGVEKKVTRKYNKAGDVTEESKFNGKGEPQSRTVTVYNDSGNKTSEQTFDGTGKMTEWYKFGYNDLQEKIFELSLDEKGKPIKKSLYIYDKNGLRTEKKTYNAKEELVSVKKYTYKTGAAE